MTAADTGYTIGEEEARAFLGACKAEARQRPFHVDYDIAGATLRVTQDAAVRDPKHTLEDLLWEFLYEWDNRYLTEAQVIELLRGVAPRPVTSAVFGRPDGVLDV